MEELPSCQAMLPEPDLVVIRHAELIAPLLRYQGLIESDAVPLRIDMELSDCHLDVPFAYALENSLTRLGVKHTDSKDPSVLLEDLLCR